MWVDKTKYHIYILKYPHDLNSYSEVGLVISVRSRILASSHCPQMACSAIESQDQIEDTLSSSRGH